MDVPRTLIKIVVVVAVVKINDLVSFKRFDFTIPLRPFTNSLLPSALYQKLSAFLRPHNAMGKGINFGRQNNQLIVEHNYFSREFVYA